MVFHEVDFDFRRVLELEHRVVVEVALYDLPVLHVDLTLECCGQSIEDFD